MVKPVGGYSTRVREIYLERAAKLEAQAVNETDLAKRKRYMETARLYRQIARNEKSETETRKLEGEAGSAAS